MVAATQLNSQHENQQPRQQLQRQQSIIQPTSLSAQEEALKRNTDCVYFLASPLTCKKGTDCEYRHSEYARVNPRDCWFWLNGNCLNPKCGYRHPPLDGLLGAEDAPVTGPAIPSSQNIATPALHAPYGPKSVPCVFFLQGQCLKGDKCLFLHGPNTSITSPQVRGTKQNSEAPRHIKTFGNLEKCNQVKRVPQANVAKSGPNGSGDKPGVGTASETNKTFVDRVVTPPVSFIGDASGSKVTSIPATVNEISARRINRLHPFHVSDHQNLQNSKDSEEFLRESSPGFDVLVDDDLRASDDYYHNEDRYERGEESLNPISEYDRFAEYNSVVDVHNHGRFQDSQTYASYDHMPGTHPHDQHMTSSERLLGGQAHLERRGYKKSGCPENVVSDLRHRLSKQRRVNGLRSVVSHDTSLDHIEERNFRSSSRKDPVRQTLNERSVSNRLRGRIKLPERSSVNGVEDGLRGRNRSLSLERPQISSHLGRLGERTNGRLQNNYDQEKNFRVQQMRRDINDAGSSDFAGPKSLAELKKDVKPTENKEQPVLGKRKKFEDGHQHNDFSFDGPKPLSEILKEKRQAASSATSLTFGSTNDKEKMDESNIIKISGSDNKDVSGTRSGFTTMVKDDVIINVTENVDRNSLVHNQSSEGPTAKANKVLDGMSYGEKLEEQELEGDDQRDEFYEDQAYEEDYNYDGDQNVDQEEYLDEEEGDDFAKKIGVMLT